MPIRIINSALLIVLAIVCAHWFWVFAGPRSTNLAVLFEPDSGKVISSIQRASLFGTAPPVSSVTTDGSGLQLRGIFADADGGIAILGFDNNRAVPVRVGSEIKPGILLVRVERDYVVVRKTGVDQRIDLPERKRLDMPPVAVDGAGRRP